MGDRRRVTCQCCGKHRADVGEISWSGLCVTCGHAILVENIRGISEKRGVAHRRRLRGYAAMLQRELLDDATAKP